MRRSLRPRPAPRVLAAHETRPSYTPIADPPTPDPQATMRRPRTVGACGIEGTVIEPASQPNRYAPPRADVADPAPAMPAAGLVLASRGKRLGGALVDVLVVAGLAGVLVWLLHAFKVLPEDSDSFLVESAIPGVIYIAIFVALNGKLLAERGQTVGKAFLGMRIVRTDGSLPSFGHSFGRRYGIGWGLEMLPWVGVAYSLVDALLIFRDSRQCLHDQIADTIVVEA